MLDELKLEALSCHIMTEQVAERLEYASELGVQYIIDPMAPLSNYEDAMRFAKKLNGTAVRFFRAVDMECT